jgi:hypothetical protein
VLAFYSSCTNQPHRFQFIYLDKINKESFKKEDVAVDKERNIKENDCQYYIEVNNIKDNNYTKSEYYDFYLPTGFELII